MVRHELVRGRACAACDAHAPCGVPMALSAVRPALLREALPPCAPGRLAACRRVCTPRTAAFQHMSGPIEPCLPMNPSHSQSMQRRAQPSPLPARPTHCICPRAQAHSSSRCTSTCGGGCDDGHCQAAWSRLLCTRALDRGRFCVNLARSRVLSVVITVT